MFVILGRFLKNYYYYHLSSPLCFSGKRDSVKILIQVWTKVEQEIISMHILNDF